MKPIATLLFLALHLSAMATIHYAKPTPSGTGNGTSWANASNDISLLLKNAVAGDEIWVSQGTYYPTLDPHGLNSFNNCFFMKNGVKLYGGFSGDGTETLLSERDFTSNKTILGTKNYVYYYERFGFDFPSHVPVVVVSVNDDESTVLDGFTIENGNAIDPSVVDTDPTTAEGQYIDWLYGPCVHNINSSPTIANCTFTNNRADAGGGAIFNRNSSPHISNSIFKNNGTIGSGGAILNISSSPVITQCQFIENWAYHEWETSPYEFFGGGAIFNINNSSPTISHCIFTSNTAGTQMIDGGGGAIGNATNSSSTVSNCVFNANSTDREGGGISCKDGSNIEIVHSTFFENEAIEGGEEYL